MTQSRTQLAEAFEVFTSASQELSDAYRALQARVLELSEQLARSRSERERELAEKEGIADRLGTVFELMPGGLLVLDSAECVLDANPRAQVLLGGGLQGQRWSEILAKAGAVESAGGAELVLADGGLVSVAGRPLEREGGRIVLLQDVSETRRLQAQLEHSQRLAAMGEMIAGVAHQIRTPLATALLQVSRIAGETGPGAGALEQLRRLDRLVQDMLVFARGGELGVESHAVIDLLEALASRFRAAFAEGGGGIELGAIDPSTRVMVNAEALLSALSNLARNALHAAPCGPLLSIGVAASTQRVAIHLQDNGPGIPAEHRERIFEPFFTSHSGGTGLGLAVAAEVVARHGGRLELLPAAGGGGAHFRLELPTQDAAAPLPSTNHVMQTAVGPIRAQAVADHEEPQQ